MLAAYDIVAELTMLQAEYDTWLHDLPENQQDTATAEALRAPINGCWSVRSMARHAGMSHSTVQPIWVKNDLKPHLTRTFKLSTDLRFEEKFGM